MNRIRITIDTELESQEEIAQVAQALLMLGGLSTETGVSVAPVAHQPEVEKTDTEKEPEQAAPVKTRSSRSRKKDPDPQPVDPDPTPDPEPDPTPDPEPDPTQHPESRQGQPALETYDHLPPKSNYTIEWVRNLLAEKVGKYRSECKAKLQALGASNVSTLDKSKYSEFVDFLNTLDV